MSQSVRDTRRFRAKSFRLQTETLEARRLLASLLSLNANTNTLSLFDSVRPTAIILTLPITGLGPNDTVNSIDVRPATGQLYATSLNAGVLTLSTLELTPTAAVATPLPGTIRLTPTRIATDFNPVTDRLRVVTRNLENFQVDPVTGNVSATNTSLLYDDATLPGPPSVLAIAYDNNSAGATSTTLYGVDQKTLKLATIGSPGGTPFGPASGRVFPYGLAFFPPGALADEGGFDIAPDGTAYFVVTAINRATAGFDSQLYRLDLNAGTIAEGLGLINLGADPSTDLSVAPVGRFQLSAPTYSVLDNAGTVTVRVTRANNLLGPATVQLATSEGTARAGVDYTITTTTVSFAEGDRFKDVTIPILNTPAHGPLTFTITISTPTGGPTLGTQTTATVTITDGDPDTVAPTVLTTQLHRTGTGRKSRVDGVVVTFSEALDAAHARDPANYVLQLQQKGRRGKPRSVGFASPVYNSDDHTVTLTFLGKAKAGSLQVVLKGQSPRGISDLAANFLANGDTVRTIKIPNK